MSQSPYTIAATTPLEVVARHMARHKLGSAVIVNANQKVIGVFTVTDGMRALADMLGNSPQVSALPDEKKKPAPRKRA
jgi:acetoin utilization protein AcuB